MDMTTIEKEEEHFNDSDDNETLVSSPREKDEDILNDHEEAEELLTKHKQYGPLGQKSRGRRKRKSSRYVGKDEDTSLVHGMEDGIRDDSSTSSESVEIDRKSQQKHSSARLPRMQLILVSCSVVVLFVLFSYGAISASQQTSHASARTYNNGTHDFDATTIYVSLDGFRADFLQQSITPAMSAFVASGVSPKYMLPSFPSVTFPNHYTLVTGLYPESHGIVGNQFWDPSYREEFYYTNTSSSMQAKWWEAAEPIWVTAEKQGVKTAIHMWPGSEAHIHGIEPTYLDKYNQFEKLSLKTDRILELLDKPRHERPQLIAAYVPDVDRDGHKYGPNSTEVRATIVRTDQMISFLLEGLLQRNLTDIVNIVIVSDHGMATMSVDRMTQLDDLVDMSLIDHIDGWPLRGIRLKNPERDLDIMYEQLLTAANLDGTFDVYTLATMPERYHFSSNARIAPLWVVPETGYLVIEKSYFDIAAAKAAGVEFDPRGVHGFDHEHPLMRAIFVARGPAFPHVPGSRVPVFQNIEAYNIVCDSIGIMPVSNNGTLRLPLVTDGLHDATEQSQTEPEEVDSTTGEPTATSAGLTSAPPTARPTGVSSTAKSEPSTAHSTVEPEAGFSIQTAAPEATELPTPSQGGSEPKISWAQYLEEQLRKAKDWAKQFLDGIKNNNPDTNTSDVT